MTGKNDNTKYSFYITPKLVIFNQELTEVLLAKRKGEADYDGTYSFIGGKLEQTDISLIKGIKREKNEEIGPNCKVKVATENCRTVFFRRGDGQIVQVPHYPAQFAGGEINLNEEEYGDFQWVKMIDLEKFEPKINNVYGVSLWAQDLLRTIDVFEFI